MARPQLLWRIGVCWLVLVLPAVFAAEQPPPTYQFRAFQQAEDAGTAELRPEGLQLRIVSTKGIGRCQVVPEQGEWPAQVHILLTNLRELEHLEVVVGRVLARGSRGQSGEFELCFLPAPGQAATNQPAGKIDVRVEARADGVWVVLPQHFVTHQEVLFVHWIDWYRQ